MIALQQFLMPVVLNLLLFLSLLLVLFLSIFVVAVIKHSFYARHSDAIRPYWNKFTDDWRLGARNMPLPGPDPVAREVLKRILLERSAVSYDNALKSYLELYRAAGFMNSDIRKLRSIWWWKRLEALECLTQVRPEGMESIVLPLLHDRSAEVRMAALIMLVAVRSPKVLEIIPEFFKNSSRWMFRAIVNRLYPLNIPADFLVPLSSSNSRDYRKAAAILLGRPGHREAIPTLRYMMRDEVKDVRVESAASLGRIGGDEACAAVLEGIDDGLPAVRAAVAGALSACGGVEAIFALKKLACDSDFDVRLKAYYSLAARGEAGLSVIRKLEHSYPQMAREFMRQDEI